MPKEAKPKEAIGRDPAELREKEVVNVSATKLERRLESGYKPVNSGDVELARNSKKDSLLMFKP